MRLSPKPREMKMEFLKNETDTHLYQAKAELDDMFAKGGMFPIFRQLYEEICTELQRRRIVLMQSRQIAEIS